MDESKDNPAAYENDAELRLLSEQVDPGITRATMETFQRRSTRKRKQPDRFTPDAEQGSLSKINGEAVDELESSTQDSLSIDPEDSNVLATPPESAEDDSPTRGPSGKKTKPPKRRKSKKPKVGDSSQRGQQQSDDSNPLHSDRGMKFRDADRECQLTSEDLTQAALQAQATNAVNPDFETSSLRLINGKWMIPVACSSCSSGRRSFCSRSSNCDKCIVDNVPCNPTHAERFMERAKPKYTRVSRVSTAIKTPIPNQAATRSVVASMAPVAPEDRPECQGRPEVWANSRQALCESLPYYQSYQGGGYTYQNHCYGFLVDGHGHFRDMVNASVVITRAGGGLKRDISGKMVATREQHEESAQCKAVQKNIFHKKPVVMILGEGHSGAPCKPIAPYCILGWFKPTHVWIEKDEGHFFYKYRFEKYDLAESSWWVSKEQQPSLFGKDVLPAETSTCASCHRSSPKIYAETWICLNEHCQDFWKLGRGLKAEKLTYGRSFLRQSTPWLGWKVPHPVKLDFAFDEGKFYDTSIGSRKGFVCPQCSMCNSRTLWSRLVCTNAAGCSFRRNVPPKPVQPESLADPNRLIGNGHADPMNTMDKDKDSPVIERPPQPIRGYRVHTYDFAECGRLVHFISNKTINAIDGGANDMFREMQEVDVGLERRKMPSTKMKGDNYTNQFSLNFGVHYEYYVDVPTRSFEESCQAVRAARTLLNWAGNDVVRNSDDDSEHFKEFNELLALGYFEKQKMNYHDDGEHGLGPTIATLSLGYPASMSLRMKAKYYTGMSKTGSYVTKAPPVPGCLKYEQRKVAHARLDGVENATERQKIGEKIIRDLQLTTKKRTTCPPLVNLTLRHGDIVIMHGFNLQKYYEHAVESQETIRFALTCRYVDPFSLKPEHRPKPATATTTHRQGADSNITQQHSVVQTVTNSDNLAKDSETINSVSDTNADAPAMVPYTPNQPMSPTILSGSAGFTVSSGIVSPPDNTGMVPMELDHDSALPDSSNPLPALNMTDTTPMDLREDSSISHGQDNTETSGATSDPTTATELDLEIMSGSSQSSELSEIECPEDVDLSVLDPVN